jgi:hypothetical protein
MRFRWAALTTTVVFTFASTSLCLAFQKKGKAPKPAPAVVEVLQLTSARGEGKVQIDGKVKNVGERPIEKLNLFFDFLGAGNAPITTSRTEVDPEVLNPGEETEFHLEMTDPVRAVRFTIRAEDSESREFKIVKPGPYPIE